MKPNQLFIIPYCIFAVFYFKVDLFVECRLKMEKEARGIIIIIIIIIILFILLGCFPQTYGLLTGAPRKVKHERTNGR